MCDIDKLCVECKARPAGRTELSRGTGRCGMCASRRAARAAGTDEGRRYHRDVNARLRSLLAAEGPIDDGRSNGVGRRLLDAELYSSEWGEDDDG